jgi:SAM-dependent methyltransferase
MQTIGDTNNQGMKRKRALDDANPTKKEDEPTVTCATDKGHRYGNFHSYYNFNPPHARISLLQRKGRILDYIVKAYSKPGGDDDDDKDTTFSYVDVGCNEGDLTVEIAKTLLEQWKKTSTGGPPSTIHATGMDLDPVLIDRAREKWSNVNDDKDCNKKANIQVRFQEADILSAETDALSADLTSLFSTTMWIHIHGGDDGLRSVLKKLCNQTKQFLLVEAQPSKCYRSATMRLRKLGQPEVDVSTERLKLRSNIEEHIDTIVREHSFRRVEFQNEKDQEDKTQWNRSLRLYERVETKT